ncbi:MAG: peptidoglycan DD-metalloendopeptidase family protein [Pseudomonadota bacterium]
MRWFAAILLLAVPIAAATTSVRAEADDAAFARAKDALTAAAELLAAGGDGPARLAALGKAVTAHEVALSAYRDGLRAMAAREAALQRDMARDRSKLESLVAALQSLGQAPRSALLAFPGGPVGAARAASLMAEMSPALSNRILSLRGQLDSLRQLRSGQNVARIEARGALAGLQELRSETIAALRSRRKTETVGQAELEEQADAARRQADTIEDLAGNLDALPTARDADRRFSDAKGSIPLPADGTLIGTMGDPDPWGRPGYGLTLEVPAYAQVTAPWDGTVRYAGTLIDYGIVVVLEPERDTLIVIAGLTSVDRLVGETVLAGERLGDMGGPIPASDEFLLEASTDRDQIRQEKLYIELRRSDQVVDPAGWFILTNKGSSK